MFCKPYAYLKFLCRATNQHGVHSPFVYQLVTLCFYDTKKRPTDTRIQTAYTADTTIPFSVKIAKLLNRLPSYLQATHIAILSQSEAIQTFITTGNTVTITTHLDPSQRYDLIYIEISTHTPDTIQQLLTQLPLQIHNDTVLIIPAIHHTKNNEQLWECIKSHPITQVSIDTFTLGFIFFRKEQAQEHFNIRV